MAAQLNVRRLVPVHWGAYPMALHSWNEPILRLMPAAAALNVPHDEERLILATGRYIGEGFDDARLDTLFLTMPIAWKGTLAQYVGRLHRRHDEKKDVLVVDYVDSSVPVLARMAAKRRTGYRALGYVME